MVKQTKKYRAKEFGMCWKQFAEEAESWFDGFMFPHQDGIRPVKRDRKRLKKLLALLNKEH